jgi:hypothetical protein
MSKRINNLLGCWLILGQIGLPIPSALAEEADPHEKFRRVCDDTLKQIKEGKLKTAGDAQAGYCANAEIWRRTYNAEKGKSIAFGATTIALVDMGVAQTAMKQVGMRAAIVKAKAASVSVDLNVTNTTGWATTAATTETAAYAAIPFSTALLAEAYQAAGTAVESAASAVQFADEAYRSLEQVKKLESTIKKMANICKKSTGAVLAAQVITDIAVTAKLNEVREDYQLAKDQMGYVNALTSAMGQGIAAIGGTSLLESMGQKGVSSELESNLASANESMIKTNADLAKANGYVKGVQAVKITAETTKDMAAAMVSATIIGSTAVTAASTASAAAKAAVAAAEMIKSSSEGGKSCYINSLGVGMMAGTSAREMLGAEGQFKSNVDNAGSIKEDSKLSTTNFTNSNLTQNNNSNNAANSPNYAHELASEGCISADSVDCLSKNDAVAAAITSSPELMDSITKTMGGKSIGSLISGFKGSSPSDVSNYLAKNSTLDSKVSLAALDSSDKIAKKNNFNGKFASGSAYASNNRKVASKSDDDFDINKMMSGLMGKMGAGNEQKGSKPGDNDYVFKQLELMTPTQIQENKGISLFTRVAYRYRKKNADLEQMNSNRMNDREVSSEKK